MQLQTSFSTIAEGVALVGEGLGDPPVVLADLTSVVGWLGLENGDDQGTRFDLRAEVYRGATLVSTALTRYVAGVTRNPNNALDTAAPVNATARFKDSAAVNFNGGNPWRTIGEWGLTVP